MWTGPPLLSSQKLNVELKSYQYGSRSGTRVTTRYTRSSRSRESTPAKGPPDRWGHGSRRPVRHWHGPAPAGLRRLLPAIPGVGVWSFPTFVGRVRRDLGEEVSGRPFVPRRAAFAVAPSCGGTCSRSDRAPLGRAVGSKIRICGARPSSNQTDQVAGPRRRSEHPGRTAGSVGNAGALGKIRTSDRRIRRPLLYPLSYEGAP